MNESLSSSRVSQSDNFTIILTAYWREKPENITKYRRLTGDDGWVGSMLRRLPFHLAPSTVFPTKIFKSCSTRASTSKGGKTTGDQNCVEIKAIIVVGLRLRQLSITYCRPLFLLNCYASQGRIWQELAHFFGTELPTGPSHQIWFQSL